MGAADGVAPPERRCALRDAVTAALDGFVPESIHDMGSSQDRHRDGKHDMHEVPMAQNHVQALVVVAAATISGPLRKYIRARRSVPRRSADASFRASSSEFRRRDR